MQQLTTNDLRNKTLRYDVLVETRNLLAHAQVRTARTLEEKPILNLGGFHGCGAFFVVVRHVVDPSANRVAPHLSSVVGLQQIGRRSHILYPRIEP